MRGRDRAWASATAWIGSGSGQIPRRAFSRASEEHAHEFPAGDCKSRYNDLYVFVLVVVANGNRVHSLCVRRVHARGREGGGSMIVEEILEAAPGTLQAAMQRARAIATRASQERHQAERAYELALVRVENSRANEISAREALETAKQAITDAELRVPLMTTEVIEVLGAAGLSAWQRGTADGARVDQRDAAHVFLWHAPASRPEDAKAWREHATEVLARYEEVLTAHGCLVIKDPERALWRIVRRLSVLDDDQPARQGF